MNNHNFAVISHLDVPDYFLRSIWTSRLPLNVQTTLAGEPEVKLDASSRFADRITEAVSPPALANIGQPTDNTALLQRMEELSLARWQLSALSGTAPSAPEILTTAPGVSPSASETATTTTDRLSDIRNAAQTFERFMDTFCRDSTSVSPTWKISSFSTSHSKITSNIYGLSSTGFRGTGS
jgi:hypothetical protein